MRVLLDCADQSVAAAPTCGSRQTITVTFNHMRIVCADALLHVACIAFMCSKKMCALKSARHTLCTFTQALHRAKQDEKARKDAEYATQYAKSLGRAVAEARNDAYLRSRTVDGRAVIDPAGTGDRIQPSQVPFHSTIGEQKHVCKCVGMLRMH